MSKFMGVSIKIIPCRHERVEWVTVKKRKILKCLDCGETVIHKPSDN